MKVKEKKPIVNEINVANIIADTDIQPRGRIDVDVVREYSDAMIEGDMFPPVAVFYDGLNYWLADGYHRYRATIKAGLPSIRANVYQGGKEEAILYSLGANADHGLRRTNDDKRRIVLRMLSHAEWCLWSNNEIARLCRVSASHVGRMRENSPGLPGHRVNARFNSNGDLQEVTPRNGHHEAFEPAYRASLPALPLTKKQMEEQHTKRLLRHLKKVDPGIKANVDTPLGVADLVVDTKAYFFVVAHDRHCLFSAIGKAILIANHLGRKAPVLVGHFSPALADVMAAAREYGVVISSPDQIIAESEA